MKVTNRMLCAMTVVALLAGWGWAYAPVAAVSEDAPLDTRSVSAMADIDDQELDTRSYTMDWSEARKLSTKKIKGTMILMR